LRWFQANVEENIMALEVEEDVEEGLRVQLTECGIYALLRDAGHPETAAIICNANLLYLSKVSKDLGGHFTRPIQICQGDDACSWRFWPAQNRSAT
jgi:hypothetical protein